MKTLDSYPTYYPELFRPFNLKEAVAFSPAHITGFFQICDNFADEAKIGSRGAGVSIVQGVTTKVRLGRSSRNMHQIVINGRVTSAPVSEHVVKDFLSRIEGKHEVFVEHKIEVPPRHGFGSSGAGALSLALALNEALDLGLGRFDAAAIAHIAEVKCKTGLGTVIGETFGGLEIRVQPGAPGVGQLMNIPIGDRYLAVCLPLGAISTKKILTNPMLRRRINQVGGKLVNTLIQHPSPENFMKCSRLFAERVGLISKKLRRFLTQTDLRGITCSMAMLGESLFTIVGCDEIEEIESALNRGTGAPMDLIISEIDGQGARVL